MDKLVNFFKIISLYTHKHIIIKKKKSKFESLWMELYNNNNDINAHSGYTKIQLNKSVILNFTFFFL